MMAGISTFTIWSHSFAYVARTDASSSSSRPSRKVTIVEMQREFGLDDRHAPTMIPLHRAATPLSVYKDTHVHRYTHSAGYSRLCTYTWSCTDSISSPSRCSALAEERRKLRSEISSEAHHLRAISQIHLESRPRIFARRNCPSSTCLNENNSHDY